MSVELTKSAKRSIALVYKEYLARINGGDLKSVARHFSEKYTGYDALRETINEDIPELKTSGFIKVFILGDFEITDAGIIFMESKTAETIKEWLALVSQFIP